MNDQDIPKPGTTASGYLPAPLYVLKGALFLKDNRVLWKYAAAPLVISMVVLGSSYALLYMLITRFVNPSVPQHWYWLILYYAVVAVAGLLLVVVFFFLFARIASAIAAPFNELISEKTEQLVTGRFVETPFSVVRIMKDSGRAIAHSFKILGVYLALLCLSLVLLVIPGFGYLLFTGAGSLLSAYMLAYEYLGYPMDRRRLAFRDKRGFLRSRLRSTLGFGLGTLAVTSVPLVNLFFLPAAVAGGTLLYLELEGAGRGAPTDWDKSGG